MSRSSGPSSGRWHRHGKSKPHGSASRYCPYQRIGHGNRRHVDQAALYRTCPLSQDPACPAEDSLGTGVCWVRYPLGHMRPSGGSGTRSRGKVRRVAIWCCVSVQQPWATHWTGCFRMGVGSDIRPEPNAGSSAHLAGDRRDCSRRPSKYRPVDRHLRGGTLLRPAVRTRQQRPSRPRMPPQGARCAPRVGRRPGLNLRPDRVL